jgi:hypothetical protein
MTFFDFIVLVFNWLETRTTRMLGILLGTLSVLVGTGVIPEGQMKYYSAAIAVLTFWRGYAISNTVTDARAIVKQQAADAASPVKTYVLQASPPPEKAP